MIPEGGSTFYRIGPGSDAIRINHYTGVPSGVVVAARIADDMDKIVTGGHVEGQQMGLRFPNSLPDSRKGTLPLEPAGQVTSAPRDSRES